MIPLPSLILRDIILYSTTIHCSLIVVILKAQCVEFKVNNMSENKNALSKLKNVFVCADDFLENNYFDDDDPDGNTVAATSIWFLIIFIFYNSLYMYLIYKSIKIIFL